MAEALVQPDAASMRRCEMAYTEAGQSFRSWWARLGMEKLGLVERAVFRMIAKQSYLAGVRWGQAHPDEKEER